MKKILCLLFAGLLLLCSSCDSPPAPMSSNPETSGTQAPSASSAAAEKTILLSDDDFGRQIEDISLLPNAYIGRKIQYSGYFRMQEIVTGRETAWVPCVLRDIPADAHGCTTAGFEVYYDGEYPEHGEWVEVTGVLDYVVHGGLQMLQVQVSGWEAVDAPADAATNAVSETASTG